MCYSVPSLPILWKLLIPSVYLKIKNLLSYDNQEVVLEANILNEIKDIKTYEFLTGLFKTFNLVVTSLGDDILVEDLPNDVNIITPNDAKNNINAAAIPSMMYCLCTWWTSIAIGLPLAVFPIAVGPSCMSYTDPANNMIKVAKEK